MTQIKTPNGATTHSAGGLGLEAARPTTTRVETKGELWFRRLWTVPTQYATKSRNILLNIVLWIAGCLILSILYSLNTWQVAPVPWAGLCLQVLVQWYNQALAIDKVLPDVDKPDFDVILDKETLSVSAAGWVVEVFFCILGRVVYWLVMGA